MIWPPQSGCRYIDSDPVVGLLILSQISLDIYESYKEAAAILRAHKDGVMIEKLVWRALILQRNFLSLPPPSCPSTMDAKDVLLHMCCTAGILFNSMVFYPYPYSSGLLPRRATQLRESVVRIQANDCTQQYEDIIIWACVLGAIAATFIPEMRDYFIGQLLTWRKARVGWPQFHDLLSSILWYEPVCGPPSFSVWESMQAALLSESASEPHTHMHLTTTVF